MTDCSHITQACSYRTVGFWDRLHDSLSLGRQRQALARLECHHLRDLGISRDMARSESARPIWDAPLRWKC